MIETLIDSLISWTTAYSFWPLVIMGLSFGVALVVFLIAEERVWLRSTVNILAALIKLLLVLALMPSLLQGHVYEIGWTIVPGLTLLLKIDGLAMLFLVLSVFLWLLTTLYAIGYLEGGIHRARFFGFFNLCVSATTGVAMAGNLFTFIIFYELLTLATWPLVVHRGTQKALDAGRIYLIYTLVGGLVLLTAAIGLHVLVGTQAFTVGGYLNDYWAENPDMAPVLFGLGLVFIAGFGVKAALFPFHGWLPTAMVAPAPVSSLLHAVAVVKAGAFGLTRFVYEIYGIHVFSDLYLHWVLLVLASFTIVYGSVRALYQSDIKKRLAFSTVSQVSYVALGLALAGPVGAIGGMIHIVHQGFMKITLFMAAGNYAETLGIHKIKELNGVGRVMPLTTLAFTIGALGMIGLPPLAGFITKWYLGLGAWESGFYWVIGVLVISSLLNAAYFLPTIYRAWFLTPPAEWPHRQVLSRRFETHFLLLAPPLVTTIMIIVLGVWAGHLATPLGWVSTLVASEFK